VPADQRQYCFWVHYRALGVPAPVDAARECPLHSDYCGLTGSGTECGLREPPDHPIWQATRFWRYVRQDDGYAWVWAAAPDASPVPWVEVTIAMPHGSRHYVFPVVDSRLQLPAALLRHLVGEFDQHTVAEARALAERLTGPIPVPTGMCPGELGEMHVTVAGSQGETSNVKP
jgi:hypothetical protein